MPKTQPLCTGGELNLRDRDLVEEKSSFALPKGGTVGLRLRNCVSSQRGFGEEFYSSGSRAGLLIKFGCVQGLHSFNLASGHLLMSFSGSFFLLSHHTACRVSVLQPGKGSESQVGVAFL